MDIEELKNHVGDIIQLPRIPVITSPKGFERLPSWNSYILTEQRFNLLKEVDDFFLDPTSEGK